jgi:very-short-patch-repair endonuclease
MQRKRPLQTDSDIENLLWLRLKALSEQGWHFRKGATHRTFRLPYVEHEKLLVVELEDGRKHIVRDRLLREAGYTILRFPRADAVQNLPSVVAKVRAVLEDRA